MTGPASNSVSSFPGEPGLPGSDLEFRATPQFRRPARSRFLTMAVLTVVIVLMPFVVLRDAAWLTGALAVVFGVTFLWRGRFATRVTSRGIEAHGYVNHFVPWDEVAGLEIGGYGAADARLDDDYASAQFARRGSLAAGGGRSVGDPSGRQARLATIKVVRANGHKLLLPAPIVSSWAPDPAFADKARQLQELVRRYGRPQGAGSA